jgi:trehalose 6-phosphate synthase
MALSMPLILCSHRGPIQFDRADGERVSERGSGGLVTALSSLAADPHNDTLWVAAALTEEDRAVAGEHRGSFEVPAAAGDGTNRVRLVPIEDDVHHDFYSITANPMLWFIQHYLWDLSNAPDITADETRAFDEGYVVVNRMFADAISDEVAAVGGRAVVMVHDYHFYLVPQLVRERCTDAFLTHFIHIPWPQPDAWRVLPPRMREPLLRGLLGNDIVAFHTERYARNFLLSCQELLGLPIDLDRSTIDLGDRTVWARWYPISIDAAAFDALATSPEVEEAERALLRRRREHLIVRIDRTDLSKNVLRGFKAFDRLLETHPELAERVTFFALLQPSRQDVPEYVEYVEKITRLVADINFKHGHTDWNPIDLRFRNDFHLAVAAYKQFDVLMVNSQFDGMNLISKEAVLVNERGGVLVLSENTGAHEELGAHALTVHPFDIEQQAEALWQALTMPSVERQERLAACSRIVRENDIGKWLRSQMRDIERKQAAGARVG